MMRHWGRWRPRRCAFEFAVDAFQAVGGAHADAVGFRQGEDAKAVGKIGFCPLGQFGSLGAPAFDGGFEQAFCLDAVGGVEDSANGAGDRDTSI